MKRARCEGAPLGQCERVTVVVANVVLTAFALMALLPCLHVVSKAVSLGTRVTAGQVSFWPSGFQLETIQYVLTKTSFFNALKNSVVVFVLGTLISMFTTVTTAYPLSKPAFKGT